MQSRYSLFVVVLFLLGSLTFDTAGQADRRPSSRQSTRSDDANTVESFGAVGDLLFKRDGAMSASARVLTSSSGTFSGSDVGKTVVVNGAGAAGVPLVSRIVSRQSARQVTLAAPAATQVSGTIFYYGTDDTAAFQRAINETVAASGGVILLGIKNYLISRALVMPPRHINLEQVAVVEFRGAIGPVRSNWNNGDQKLGGFNDVKLPIAGQTIVQTASLSGKIIDFDWQTPISQAPSGVQVAFQNIVFRVPAKSSTTGLDLQHAYSCRIIDVTVEPSDHQSNLPLPVPGGIGIRLPRVGNGAQVVLDRVGVAGFDTGIRFSEHTDLRDVWIYRCRYALIAEAGHHASQWGRVTIHWCPYGLISEANIPAPLSAFVTDGGLFNIEDGPAGHWSQPIAHIHDPGNNLRGSIVYHRGVPFVGKVSGITVSGARNLLRREYGSRDYDTDAAVVSLPFSDGFNREDFANISADKKWTLTPGTSGVIRNNSAALSGNAEAIAWLESNVNEYEVRADVTLSPARAAAGLVVKYESVGTYMAAILEIHSVQNRVRLFKRENGTYVDLATAPVSGMRLGGTYRLAVRYDAGVVKVFVEGAEKINHTLTPPEVQHYEALTQFGLYSYMSTAAEDGGSRWDDLTAVPF